MLRLRPYSRIHWIGVALAYKLAGNVAEARRYLEHIDGFLRVCHDHRPLLSHSFCIQNVPVRDPEYGELVFFYIRVLEEGGEFEEALSLLDKKAKDRLLVDRPAIAECRGKQYLIYASSIC